MENIGDSSNCSEFISTHPFIDLESQIEEGSVILGEHNFGAHFHGYGKGIVKGRTLFFAS